MDQSVINNTKETKTVCENQKGSNLIVPSPKEYIEILPNDLLTEVKYCDTDY